MPAIKGTEVWRHAIMLRNNGERPAAVILAKILGFRRFGRSRKLLRPIAQNLDEALSKIGPIGTKVNNNMVGYCAEVAASNKLLLQPHLRKFKPKDIALSKAIRPRTMQVVPMCRNCIQTFT